MSYSFSNCSLVSCCRYFWTNFNLLSGKVLFTFLFTFSVPSVRLCRPVALRMYFESLEKVSSLPVGKNQHREWSCLVFVYICLLMFTYHVIGCVWVTNMTMQPHRQPVVIIIVDWNVEQIPDKLNETVWREIVMKKRSSSSHYENTYLGLFNRRACLWPPGFWDKWHFA